MASTGVTDTSIPVILPQAGQTFADPAMELATRNILASYFGTGQPGDLGLMGQPIPIPIQQVAGLSPLEVQARNAAQGLGGFGGLNKPKLFSDSAVINKPDCAIT